MPTVEIWSDVVCPWCAIGRVRFQRALEEFDRADDVQVRWRSFELDPGAPPLVEGDYVTRLARKYRVAVEQAQQMIDRMTQTGSHEGIDFRFDRARPGNTFDAHRVLHLAADRDRQHQVKGRFLRGYHTEGEAIGEADVLLRLAVDAGLEEDDVAEVLAGDAYAGAVRADETRAREYGISGVPFFVFDGRFGASGAQPPEVLLDGLRRLVGEDRRTV